MNISVAEIAECVTGTVIGDGSVRITGVSGLEQARRGDLTFVANPRYRPLLKTTKASAALVSRDIAHSDKPLIQVSNPYLALAKVLQEFQPPQTRHPTGIHPTAVVGKNVQLGKDVAIDANVYIGDDSRIGDGVIVYPGVCIGYGCTIGEQTRIYPNVTVRESIRIGARCIIHGGVVLGSDGFGFVTVEGVHHKIPQTGAVVIGDDVEIGANTAVDRATFGDTVIGRGTKIDNLVQVGHNVAIGEHCVISGNAGISGSAAIGDHVTIAAGAGVNGHLEIGDGATIGALSGVTKSIKPGQVVSGFPAIDHNTEMRAQASMRRLPDALRRIKELEQRVCDLEGKLHGKTEDDR